MLEFGFTLKDNGYLARKKYSKDKLLRLVECAVLDTAIFSPCLHFSREEKTGFVN